MSTEFGAEDFICENEEWGEECDYPFCSCEEEDIFYNPFEIDDLDEELEVEIEEYD